MFAGVPWGSVAALATALCWSFAVVLFKLSGKGIPPFGLNFFKNALALPLLIVTSLAWPAEQGLSLYEIGALALSGAIGIGLADTLMFRSLNLLGAGRSAIVDCTYGPLVVLLSMGMLGERLSAGDALGATMVVLAVLLVGLRPGEGWGDAAELAQGIALGVIAMALMAVAIVAVTPILRTGDVLLCTTTRMFGGVASLSVVAALHEGARSEVRAALTPQPAWRYAIPGSFIGAYVALVLWIAGFKYGDAGVAAILNQTSTPMIVVLAAVWLREPTPWRSWAAVGVAFAGSLLVLL